MKFVQSAIHSTQASRELQLPVELSISSIVDTALSRTNKNRIRKRLSQGDEGVNITFCYGRTESQMRWSYFFRRKYEGFGNERISCS